MRSDPQNVKPLIRKVNNQRVNSIHVKMDIIYRYILWVC